MTLRHHLLNTAASILPLVINTERIFKVQGWVRGIYRSRSCACFSYGWHIGRQSPTRTLSTPGGQSGESPRTCLKAKHGEERPLACREGKRLQRTQTWQTEDNAGSTPANHRNHMSPQEHLTAPLRVWLAVSRAWGSREKLLQYFSLVFSLPSSFATPPFFIIVSWAFLLHQIKVTCFYIPLQTNFCIFFIIMKWLIKYSLFCSTPSPSYFQ